MTRTAGWLQEATDRGGILQSFPYHTMFNGYSETHIKYGVRDLKDPEKNVSSAFLQISPSAHKGILFLPIPLFPTKGSFNENTYSIFPYSRLVCPKGREDTITIIHKVTPC